MEALYFMVYYLKNINFARLFDLIIVNEKIKILSGNALDLCFRNGFFCPDTRKGQRSDYFV